MTASAIYKPTPDEGFELCHPVDKKYFVDLIELMNGAPHLANWKPITVRIVRVDEGHTLLPSDSPWLDSDTLIFRPTAVLAMGGLLQQNGELLPLICGDERLVMYNPTRVIDALDEEHSELTRFPSGRIMMIQRYEFRPAAVRGIDVFKLPLRGSTTFVSQRFVDTWNANGLKGVNFKRVWTSG